MVRLLLLRHAKSDWGTGATDFDRPLAPRGERQAPVIGERMAEHGYIPTRILCSAARRARLTLSGVLPAIIGGMPDAGEIAFARELYDAGPADYLGVIAARGGGAPSLMLVGHNPATQATALKLAGGGDEGQRQAMAAKFPTAALAVIDFDTVSWGDIAPGSGQLVDFLTAK